MTRASPLRVLLADDQADIRELLRVALEADGRLRVVGEAADGLQAIEAVVAHRPDAIVLDLAMPGFDGLQAIPAIRRGSPTTKIVILSGFGADQMAAQAIELGADLYLEKCAGFGGVAEVVAGLCRSAAVHRAPGR